MSAARGRLITFEGGEGSGKSTQSRLLAEALVAAGREVVCTREPGGTPQGEKLRTLLIDGDDDEWDATAEALLHFAARRMHLVRLIAPALAAGCWVVCDRFADSTLAYQGFGMGLGRAPIERLAEITLGGFAPDLTFILDLPVEEGLARARARGDANRYERRPLTFHERMRAGYLEIAKAAADRCVVLDARRPAGDIAGEVAAVVGERLPVPVDG